MGDLSFYQLLKMRGVNFSREAFDEQTERELLACKHIRTIRDNNGTVIGFEPLKEAL